MGVPCPDAGYAFLLARHSEHLLILESRERCHDANWAIGIVAVRHAGGLDPWGNLRAGFLADAEIDWEEFDITWNQALEAGGFLVGKEVRVEIDVEAIRRADV